MPSPTTEAAWEALLDDLAAEWDNPRRDSQTIVRYHRPLIEAEAVADERARIRAGVEALPQHAPCVSMDTGATLARAAVLAIVDPS